jgi:signal transduction histidine kinase
VKSLRTRLIPRNEQLIEVLHKYINKDDLKNVPEEDNPFNLLQYNYEEDLKLKHWLDYSLNSLKRDKRERYHVVINDYFKAFTTTWKKALERRKISLDIKGKNSSLNIVKAFEVDFDVIFNNLLSNSIAAFKEKRGRYNKQISIDWERKGKFIEILFSDNGIGLSDEYKENPYEIFNLFETSKRDYIMHPINQTT